MALSQKSAVRSINANDFNDHELKTRGLFCINDVLLPPDSVGSSRRQGEFTTQRIWSWGEGGFQQSEAVVFDSGTQSRQVIRDRNLSASEIAALEAAEREKRAREASQTFRLTGLTDEAFKAQLIAQSPALFTRTNSGGGGTVGDTPTQDFSTFDPRDDLIDLFDSAQSGFFGDLGGLFG